MNSVSVIVAVFNRARTLQACLDSIYAQTARPLEIIVCDGGSNDGSREIIESNASRLSYWQSQKDRGVAHAWNMALERASGDWICFLGADDCFAQTDSVAKLLEAASDPATNYVSGQAALVDDGGIQQRVIGERWDWERMKRYQHIAHPGSLHRRELFTRYGDFDEDLAIAFDYDFLLRAGRELCAAFVAQPVTLMGCAGQSNAQAWRAFRENRRIQRAHPEIGARAAAINHAIAAAKQVVRAALRYA